MSDHPRECGANRNQPSTPFHAFGSSPRVRGKRERINCMGADARIIPASAGQTSCRHAARPASTDHPRECGANCQIPFTCLMVSGSSPRVRGKPLHGVPHLADARIIPASAGQTPMIVGSRFSTADHPRECGANLISFRTQHRPCGSSPRVRGKQLVGRFRHVMPRIIPASAGQTT